MIKLVDDFYLDTDTSSYVVKRRCTKEGSGEVYYKPLSWHGSISEAVRATANRAVRAGVEAGEIESLKAAADKLESIMQEITAAVAGTESAGLEV